MPDGGESEPARILEQARKLAEAVREYSRSQSELWQQIPYLALQADGRDGYHPYYSNAYDCGYWAIESSAVYVDLSNGELMDAASIEGYRITDSIVIRSPLGKLRASDSSVLMLALHLNELDAGAVIKLLEQAATKPTCGIYDPQKQDEWRAGKIKELNLKPRMADRSAWKDD